MNQNPTLSEREALEPCPNPWCISTTPPRPVGLTNGYGNRSGWVVACGCGIRTHRANTRHAAVSGWNTRRPPPDRPDLADLDRGAPVAPAEPVADELRLRLKLAKAGGADVIKFSPAEVENVLAALATHAQPSPVTPEEEIARIKQAIDAGDATAVCFYDSHTREDRFASLIKACRQGNVRGVEVTNREALAADLEAVASPVTGALEVTDDMVEQVCREFVREADGFFRESTWPDDIDDDGYRGGAWVRLLDQDTLDEFRASMRRALSMALAAQKAEG